MTEKKNKQKDCFESWFNSPYYHILYKNRDEKEAAKFLKKLIDFLNLKKKSRILDLACGRGRHAHYLAKKNFEVVGIDLSEENILFAKKNSKAKFFTGDMREIFKENYFDAVLNLFTSFGYFESEKDDLKVLKSVHRQLKKNGIFVLDFLNVKKAIANLNKEEVLIIDNLQFKISRCVKKGFICKKIKAANQIFEERIKAITLENFKKYFSKTGFKITHILGDYDLNNFDPENSDRLIFIAKKTGKFQ